MRRIFEYVKPVLCIVLCAAMVMSLGACRNSDPEEVSSIIYIVQSGEESSQVDNNSSSKNNDTSSKTSSIASNSTQSNTKDDDTNLDYKGDQITAKKKKRKDLKGRQITVVGTWAATSTTSPAYKHILALEEYFNIDFVERQMADYTALYSSILAGQPICDLFFPSGTSWLNMANKKMIQPLSDLDAFDFREEYWSIPTARETTLNGKIYGMAYNLQIRRVLLYNKTMFASESWGKGNDLYELQKSNKLTWDKMFSIMKSAVKKDSAGKVTRYGLVPEYTVGRLGQTMLNANGAKIASRDYGTSNFKYTLGTQSALNALRTFNEWASYEGALYDSSTGAWDSGNAIFYNGNAAIIECSYHMFTNIEQNADFDIGMVLFPHGPDTKNDYVRYEMLPTLMPVGVKNPNDVAMVWDYWAYLNSDGKKTDANAYKGYFDDDPSVVPTIKRYLDGLENGSYIIDEGESMSFGVELDDIAYGNITPASYVNSVKNQFKAAINSFWK